MQLATPSALLLLIIFLPIVWYFGFPRHAFRRWRDITSLILRTTIIILLVLALSGLQNVQDVDKLAVVFLVDVSDSMGTTTQDDQLAYIREAIAGKIPEDEWAVVLFGDNAVPESDFSIVQELEAFGSIPVTTHTDIGNAIQTALSMFPPDASRRIVILSDGQATQGDAIARAQRASASGVEISYVPFFREPAPDVRITAIDAPSRVAENQDFDISVSINAEAPTPATLLIFSSGSLIHEEDLDLQTGDTRYTLTQTSQFSGFLDFSAQIVVPNENDNFSQNNQLAAFSQVVGPSRVLLVTSDEEETQFLLPALEQAGIIVDVALPENLPVSIPALANYKSIILANVPATDLANAQMELLDQYVKDIGGGLVVVGGPETYAPGGYYQTPLERTLPVEMQIKDQQRLPQLTIAYLIDRSGSMGQIGRSGVPNLELGKRAIVISLDLLQPTDRAAIGTFDTGGAWVAPFQNVNDNQSLIALTNTIRSGGGTDILSGLNLVQRDIINEPSEVKHLILLTDGGASPNGLVELVESLNDEHDVTLSAIAIGRSPANFLERMAVAGEGNYYQVQDVEQIPRIFTQETVLASRSYIIEDTFTPRLTGNNAIMDGMNSLPALRGYVATTAKTAAQKILSGPEPFSDPILTSWQYGLGRVVAWTSDATSRWANEWVAWDDFSRFWGQAVSWSINEGANNNLETRIIMENGEARIVVDARDNNGEFLNGLLLTSSQLSPDGMSRRVPLQQTASGRYEVTFDPQTEGAYFLTINGNAVLDEQDTTLTDINGWVMSYSSEYITRDQDDTLLAQLADITDGDNLAEIPTDVFLHNLGERQATSPIWETLVIIALILLVFDIAVRRLIITRTDINRLRAYMAGRGTEQDERSERLEALLNVRERARESTGYGENKPIDTIGQLRRKQSFSFSEDSEPDDAPKPTGTPRSSYMPSQSDLKGNQAPEGNLGTKLLKSRRRRRGEDEEE
jgi:uncharacterized membrane protein